jgi:drug/metabolite transporter (DMT)-like permease
LVEYLGFLGVVLAPFDALVETWSMPGGVDAVYMILVGLFAFVGQFLFNYGGAREKAGVSSLVRNLDIVATQAHTHPHTQHPALPLPFLLLI